MSGRRENAGEERTIRAHNFVAALARLGPPLEHLGEAFRGLGRDRAALGRAIAQARERRP